MSSDQKNKVARNVVECHHHAQAEFCTTRAAYRQGKELKAVKVYTINDESRHLLIQNVPSIGLLEEIKRLTAKFGKIETVELLLDYPTKAEFTHAYYVKYSIFREARLAKKKLDNRSFFGSLLHVCYAPELESVEECKQKLKSRIHGMQTHGKQNPFKWKTKNNKNEDCASSTSSAVSAAPSFPAAEGTWYNLIPPSASRIVNNNN